MIAPANAECAARAATHAQAVKDLTGFSVNGATPFGPFPNDLSRDAAETAHALAIVLSNAIHSNGVESEESMPSRPCHLASAVGAIGTLIALSLWARGAEAAA